MKERCEKSKRIHTESDEGSDGKRKQVRRGERSHAGISRERREVERGALKTKVMAHCEKRWLISLSRSETTMYVTFVYILTAVPEKH